MAQTGFLLPMPARLSAIFPYLKLTGKQEIEQIILAYIPEIDFAAHILEEIRQGGNSWDWTKKSAIYRLNESRYEQWCILETIGESLLSPIAFKQLQQLRRKFPGRKVEEPNNFKMRAVVSPVKREQCRNMSDRAWLSAIQCYNNEDDRTREDGRIYGGARELARELQEATKNDPKDLQSSVSSFPKLHIKPILNTSYGAYQKRRPRLMIL